ncbi:hypothetical protein BH20CHL6_BH20CHL6_15400 [soil metagenome]
MTGTTPVVVTYPAEPTAPPQDPAAAVNAVVDQAIAGSPAAILVIALASALLGAVVIGVAAWLLIRRRRGRPVR